MGKLRNTAVHAPVTSMLINLPSDITIIIITDISKVFTLGLKALNITNMKHI